LPDDEAVREFSESVVKIPLNPPLLKGDENGFSPLAVFFLPWAGEGS
jgi:hypothetical protein